MSLNTLFNIPGSKKVRKRVGRGIGSGTGKTCGRGVKGQKSRSGVAIKNGGEQTPLYKQLPKRGFSCDKSVKYNVLTLENLDALISTKKIDFTKEINNKVLAEVGFIKSESRPVKLLAGFDQFKHKVSVQVNAYSKTAKEQIEKLGGKAV